MVKIIRTEHKTLNKKLKALIVAKMPDAHTIKARTIDHKKNFIVRDAAGNILGWAEKERDSYKLVVKK